MKQSNKAMFLKGGSDGLVSMKTKNCYLPHETPDKRLVTCDVMNLCKTWLDRRLDYTHKALKREDKCSSPCKHIHCMASKCPWLGYGNNEAHIHVSRSGQCPYKGEPQLGSSAKQARHLVTTQSTVYIYTEMAHPVKHKMVPGTGWCMV